jgi:hypothetical protein
MKHWQIFLLSTAAAAGIMWGIMARGQTVESATATTLAQACAALEDMHTAHSAWHPDHDAVPDHKLRHQYMTDAYKAGKKRCEAGDEADAAVVQEWATTAKDLMVDKK